MHRFQMKAYRCVSELEIHEISAPGVRLGNKDDLYLSICLLGQERRTRLGQAQFPLKFDDRLTFEKTFKFCRDESDVVNFLDDLCVLIELIQLDPFGNPNNNRVLAWFETKSKYFLYPVQNMQLNYLDSLRDLFMTKTNHFPGSISPQLIFSVSTRVLETQTPSLDILREYEQRFAACNLQPQPIIRNNTLSQQQHQHQHPSPKQSSRRPVRKAKQKQKNKNKDRDLEMGLNASACGQDVSNGFANHTISSAIKADYQLPGVKYKLDELNASVKKTKVVRQVPTAKTILASSLKPFVARHVERRLIERKPSLHDVMHDGLVLTKKNPNPTTKRNSPSSRKLRSASSVSWNDDHDLFSYSDYYNSNQQHNSNNIRNNNNYNNLLSSSCQNLYSEQNDFINQNQNVQPFSLNESLTERNRRYASLNSSNHSLNDEGGSNLNLSNDEVCQPFSFRTNLHGERPSSSSKPAKTKKNNFVTTTTTTRTTERSPSSLFNKTRLLRSEDLPRKTFRRSTSSNGTVNQNRADKSFRGRGNVRSRVTGGGGCYQEWEPYYPWLHNYTSYLREMESELCWLKQRSRANH